MPQPARIERIEATSTWLTGWILEESVGFWPRLAHRLPGWGRRFPAPATVAVVAQAPGQEAVGYGPAGVPSHSLLSRDEGCRALGSGRGMQDARMARLEDIWRPIMLSRAHVICIG